MTILVVNGKHYQLAALEDVSLRHALALQRELAVTNISSARTWADVKALLEDVAALEPAERVRHPESVFVTALTVWASMVAAGEDVGLLEAVDIPMTCIRFVTEPTDKAQPAGKGKPRGAGRPKTSAAK